MLIDLEKIILTGWRRLVLASVLVLLGLLAGGAYVVFRDPVHHLRVGAYFLAFQYYSSAADQGDRQAQTVVGNLYLLGLGVERDGLQAARWYLKAALAGHVPAQVNLGQLYLNGRGVPRDVGKAVGWFYLAKQASSDRAERHLNYITSSNLIFPLMYETAIENFKNLAFVRGRFQNKGEAAFLLK